MQSFETSACVRIGRIRECQIATKNERRFVIDGVGGVKRRGKVTLEHGRRALRVLVDQTDDGLVIRWTEKIDQQHGSARRRASSF